MNGGERLDPPLAVHSEPETAIVPELTTAEVVAIGIEVQASCNSPTHPHRQHNPDDQMKVELLPGQNKASQLYNSDVIQIVVAGLIMGNFALNIIEKEIDPAGDLYEDTFGGFELFFNIVFLLELLVNMYGHWFRRFWSSGWNCFDFVVVSIGILDLAEADLGPLNLLRMLRAFRVFRLFKKIKSLNKIIVSLAHALPGVANAFAITLLVMCIYAVLGCESFRKIHNRCNDETNPDESPGARTPRNMCYGEDYYGNFLRTLYTLFQVLTGESWSEAVVRPVLHFYNKEEEETLFSPRKETDIMSVFGAAVFFTSFIIVNSVVLMNVVVAVLLDGMNACIEELKAQEKALAAAELAADRAEEAAAAGLPPPGTNGCAEQQNMKILNDEIALLKAEVAQLPGDINNLFADYAKSNWPVILRLQVFGPTSGQNKHFRMSS